MPELPVYGPFGDLHSKTYSLPQTTSFILSPHPYTTRTSPFGRAEIIRVLERIQYDSLLNKIFPWWNFRLAANWPLTDLAPFPQHHFWIVLSMFSLNLLCSKNMFNLTGEVLLYYQCEHIYHEYTVHKFVHLCWNLSSVTKSLRSWEKIRIIRAPCRVMWIKSVSICRNTKYVTWWK